MKRIPLILLFATIYINIDVHCQTGVKLKALKQGDAVPDIALGKIINYSSPKAKFSDFKGQALILDFWATYCMPCIPSLHKMDSLQHKFFGEITFMPVNSGSAGENVTKARFFFSKNKIHLPSVVEDTTLKKLFPHILIPHLVWIDQNGVVAKVTDHTQLTEQNVAAFIGGQQIEMRVKSDAINFDRRKVLAGVNINNFIFFSALRKHIPGTPTGMFGPKVDSIKGQKRFYYFNEKILNLFHRVVYNKLNLLNRSRIFFDIKDSTLFKTLLFTDFEFFKPRKFPYLNWETNEAWKRNNLYNYELVVPASMPDSLMFQYALQDLNRYFPVRARVEQRIVPVWVLTNIDSTGKLLKSKGGEPKSTRTGTIMEVQNQPMEEFLRLLNLFRDVEPIIDETGYTGTVDIKLNFESSTTIDRKWGLLTNSTADIPVLKTELSKYGLRLTEENRLQDVLVITDKF